jgi:fibronectin-binding autotransporter adhesin
VTNGFAKGGDGGDGGISGADLGAASGGGLGAGGAVLVADGANLTLKNVSFTHNVAQGGNAGDAGIVAGSTSGGGGGGLGGNGADAQSPTDGGGGGGIFISAVTSNGVNGGGDGAMAGPNTPAMDGGFGGGGGGGATDTVAISDGADGGFGGGGGGGALVGNAANTSLGGDGGFGAGGGGGGMGGASNAGGQGSFAGDGGNGGLNSAGGGGGGSGYGGGLFAQSGAIVTIEDCTFDNQHTTTAGTGGAGAGGGGAGTSGFNAGNAMYLMSSVDATIKVVGFATVDESISGQGGFTKTGAGQLTLTGTNDYTGGTTVSDGTLVGNTNSLQGLITNNAAIIFDQNFLAADFNGTISGTGTLTVYDPALQIVSDQLYTGGTTIGQKGGPTGVLVLRSPNAISQSSFVDVEAGSLLAVDVSTRVNNLFGDGAVTLRGADLTVDQQMDLTLEGILDILGASTLFKTGSGSFTLLGNNSNGGQIIILEGSIIGNSTSLDGSFVIGNGPNNPGYLIFNQETPGTSNITTTGSIGTLIKTGPATLTLTGALAHGGGTVIEEGNLVVNENSMVGNFTFVALPPIEFPMLTYDSANNHTYSDQIDGFGAFTKAGTGTLGITGINTYVGPTSIQAGTLLLANPFAISTSSAVNIAPQGTLEVDVDTDTYIKNLSGSGFINLLLNSNLIVDNEIASIYQGVISGLGGLVKEGPADLSLTGLNTYAGGTAVDEGTLTVTTRSLPGDTLVVAGSTLIFNQNFDGAFVGDITGAGAVGKQGSGRVFLVSPNTYSGGTTVSDGTLAGNSISLQGQITNNATLAFAQPFDGTYAGEINGTGTLVKEQGGKLTLSQVSTYTGPTQVDGGTLEITGAGSISKSSSVDLATGTTLLISTATTVNQLFGDGDVVLDATLTVNHEQDATLEGIISGMGGLIKHGKGTFTILGANTYTGGTTIHEGALQGTSTSLTGDFIIGTGGNQAKLIFNQDFDGTDNITTSGPGSLEKTGTGKLTLTNTLAHTGGTNIKQGKLCVNQNSMFGSFNIESASAELIYNDPNGTIYAGNISGLGTFRVTGSGSLQLNGSSSFTGPTFVENGVLVLNNASAISSSSSVNINTPGSLLALVSTLIQELSGDGTIAINNGIILSVENNNDSKFEGIISGAGGLTKTGTADLYLTGANTYFGATLVDEGSLSVTTNSALTAGVTVNATSELIFNQNFNGAYSGVITGGGAVEKLGSGIVTLTGANTYTGGTLVSAGTLAGTTTSLQGNITNNSILSFDQAANGTYSGVINGTGDLQKKGAGTLTLSGASTFTGATTIFGGTLELTNANSISSSKLVDIEPNTTLLISADTTVQNIEGSGTINIPDAMSNLTIKQDTTTTYTGMITGAGSIEKTGTGNLILSGQDNDYTGGTLITEGILTGNSESLQGIIVNNTQLVINQTFSGDDAGIVSVSGTGDVIKIGVATFTLNGNWTHTGKTLINQGPFVLIGSVANSSETVVAPTAYLRGTGTTGPLTVLGRVHGGGSIGTLNVIGTYTQEPGSFLDVDLDAGGAASLINVMGNAIINDQATIFITPEPGLYSIGQQYVVINTTAGVTGLFDNVIIVNEEELDGATLTPIYTPLQVLLQVAPIMITPDRAAPAFLNSTLAIQSSFLTDSILTGQLDWATQMTPCCDRETCCYTPFIVADYVTGHGRGTDTSLKTDYSVCGIFAGVDTYICDSALIGVAGGIVKGHANAEDINVDNNNGGFSLAVYGRKDWCECSWVLDGYVAGVCSEFKSHRCDLGKIHGKTWGASAVGKLRFSYEYNRNCLYFRPQVGLFGDYSFVDGFAETSSSKRKITFDRGQVSFLYGEAALAVGFPISCGCGILLPEVKGGYVYDFLDESMHIDTIMPIYPHTDTDFKIDTINKSHYFVRGGISFGVCGDTKIGAYYEGVYSGNRWNNHSWRIAFNSGF